MEIFLHKFIFLLTLLLNFWIPISAIVEPGFKDFELDFPSTNGETQWANFTKSMYPGTGIVVTIRCEAKNSETKNIDKKKFHIDAILLQHRCHQPEEVSIDFPLSSDLLCHKSVVIPEGELNKLNPIDVQKMETEDGSKAHTTVPVKAKRDAALKKNSTAGSLSKKLKKKVGENNLPAVKVNALYRLEIGLKFLDKEVEAKIKVQIAAKLNGGYLSSVNWPLLPFYGVMSLVYLAYAVGWFIASCCNWRDLLRVQFWIGAVIAIGMLENALFYGEYQSISHTGKENGLLYFAEIVSCVKRALARILVIIVSMGFGIVKPRLGQQLHKVIATGTLYFLLAAVEGCIRVHDDRLSKTQMYALIPLTVLDVCLCWWIFSSLVQTTRTLRIRKNIVKLTLYRHFTNTLIFTVIASLAYMAWTIKQTKFTNCIGISTIWLNDALWPFLFAVILAVIMVLWRPSNNNQRYAFTPLDLGDSEDDEDDITLSDAFEGMKMRNKSESQANGSVQKSKKAEDDLKWVEENIPSVPSTLLPTIDSDEEILTTKFEISKMD